MKQTERIEAMERRMQHVAAAVEQLTAALAAFEEAGDDAASLDAYYGSEEWRQDLAADEAGRLPKEMKRGVLSEDGLWNLLADYRELKYSNKLYFCSTNH